MLHILCCALTTLLCVLKKFETCVKSWQINFEPERSQISLVFRVCLLSIDLTNGAALHYKGGIWQESSGFGETTILDYCCQLLILWKMYGGCGVVVGTIELLLLVVIVMLFCYFFLVCFITNFFTSFSTWFILSGYSVHVHSECHFQTWDFVEILKAWVCGIQQVWWDWFCLLFALHIWGSVCIRSWG